MKAVEANIALGEAGTVVQPAHRALAGGTGLIVIAQGVGLGVGLGSIAIVGALLSIGTAVISPANAPAFAAGYWHWAPLLQIAAGVLGLKIGERIGAAKHYRAFLDGLRKRGTPETLATRYQITPDAFLVQTDRLSYAAAWPSLLEVFLGPRHWLLQTDTITFILPRDAFATLEAERSFMAEFARHLPASALKRSQSALQMSGI